MNVTIARAWWPITAQVWAFRVKSFWRIRIWCWFVGSAEIPNHTLWPELHVRDSNSRFRVSRTDLIADSECTQTLEPRRVLHGLLRYFMGDIGAPNMFCGSVSTETRADHVYPSRNTRTNPEKPYQTSQFAYIPNLRPEPSVLPGIASYMPERVILVGSCGSVFLQNRHYIRTLQKFVHREYPNLGRDRAPSRSYVYIPILVAKFIVFFFESLHIAKLSLFLN